MRIERIHIDRFGKFEDQEFGPFQKGVNIIEGPNEAGKSTLLSFLRYTLFGFPRLKSAPFRTEKGSAAGGRVGVVEDDGARMTLERHEGSKGGPFRIHYSDGSISEEEGDRLNALGNADEHLFKNIYAFTLDELSDPDVLKDEALMERIMSAGYGTGKIGPEAVRRRIQAKADERYKKRKQTAEFNELKAAIDRKDEEIREREEEQARYDPLVQELKEVKEKKEARRKEERDKEQELGYIDRALALYPYFNRYQEAREKLDRIGDPVPITEQDGERMERSQEEKRQKSEELEEVQRSLDRTKSELEELQPDADILAQEARIKELAEQRALYSDLLKDRDEALREKEAARERFEERSRDLGSKSSEQEIREMGSLEEEKGVVKSFQKEFETIEAREREYDARLRERPPQGVLRTHHVLFIGMAILLALSIGVWSAGYSLLGGIFLLLGLGVGALTAIAVKRYQKHEDPLEKERERISKEREELEDRWKEWLRSRDHPTELRPEAAMDRLTGLDELLDILRKKDEEEKKAEQLQKRMDELKEELLDMPGVEHLEEDDIPTAIRELGERSEDAKEKERQRKEKKERLKELQERKEELEQARERCRKAIGELLQKAGAEGSDSFFEKLEQRKEWEQARTKKDEAWENIEDSVGKGNGEELLAFLKEKDKRELEERKRVLEDELSRSREEKESFAQREAVLEKEKEALEEKSDPMVLKNEREALWTRLRMSYKEWVADRIALEVLDGVRERYEREQQPSLVRKASRYFERITEGKYGQIRVPFGSDEDRTVRVFDRNGVPNDLSVLSRGTREQLLLSVRLGFIEEYEERREALPVVMDEVLVDFDRERAKASAGALEEFAQERQLLLFTCHPELKELFGEDAQVFRLEG